MMINIPSKISYHINEKNYHHISIDQISYRLTLPGGLIQNTLKLNRRSQFDLNRISNQFMVDQRAAIAVTSQLTDKVYLVCPTDSKQQPLHFTTKLSGIWVINTT
jgi:hypothetical protein